MRDGLYQLVELVQTSFGDFEAASRQSVIVLGGCRNRMYQNFHFMNSCVKLHFLHKIPFNWYKYDSVLFEKLKFVKLHVIKPIVR